MLNVQKNSGKNLNRMDHLGDSAAGDDDDNDDVLEMRLLNVY
jgi:hypothetical protein